jgi:secondary thiamine-phosphate synthase enzyme
MEMGEYHTTINIQTKGENDIIDITDTIQRCVKKSHLENGICCIFVPGSTGTITTLEYEPGLKKDIPLALEKIAPVNQYYAHHETWHDDNGRSHVKASLMGPSITIPFQNKKIIHGTWQQIVFIELDTRSRNRSIIVQLVGE